MKKYITLVMICLSSLAFSVGPGEKAPMFKSVDQNGKEFDLAKHKDSIIVLEWYNDGCPFVRKHYDSKNMQTIQNAYKENKNVKWVTIVSSAKGKQGYLADSSAALAKMKEEGMNSDYIIRDTDGKIGQMYGAKTTPHMYVLGFNQEIEYVGAIDSVASADPADIKGAKNYITSAVSKVLLQEKPSPQKTKPYGCSVKY